MRRVVLHVDRLVLRGIERADAAGIAAGMETELCSLLAADGAVATLAARHSVTAVRAGRAGVPQGAGALAVGRAIAKQIIPGGRA